MDIYFCEYGMIRLLMNLFLELIEKDRRDKMMKVRKILFACLIVGFLFMFLLLKYNPRNNRAYLENRIGTEVSRVYPTQKLEDLFEQFPKGFIVYQARMMNEKIVELKLTGTEKGAPIKGELIEAERKSGEDTRVVSVEYYNGKYTFSDEKAANELWPQQSFLFQKITLNKDFLSTLKLKDKYYSSMNGSFELNYDVNLPEINEYLSFPASKSIELSFGGSNSNRNYYYSVVVRDKDGYYFRETVYE
jgi:hypothetical protein